MSTEGTHGVGGGTGREARIFGVVLALRIELMSFIGIDGVE